MASTWANEIYLLNRGEVYSSGKPEEIFSNIRSGKRFRGNEVIAIDSSPLIHLSKIGRLDILENCSLITTESVRGEVIVEGKTGVSGLKEFFDMVEVVKLSEKDIDTASSIVKSEYVHQADAELLLLAKKKNCTLLTNDRALVLLTRSMGIKVW